MGIYDGARHEAGMAKREVASGRVTRLSQLFRKKHDILFYFVGLGVSPPLEVTHHRRATLSLVVLFS